MPAHLFTILLGHVLYHPLDPANVVVCRADEGKQVFNRVLEEVLSYSHSSLRINFLSIKMKFLAFIGRYLYTHLMFMFKATATVTDTATPTDYLSKHSDPGVAGRDLRKYWVNLAPGIYILDFGQKRPGEISQIKYLTRIC